MFKRVFPWQVGTIIAIFVLGSKKLQRKGRGGEDGATNRGTQQCGVAECTPSLDMLPQWWFWKDWGCC